MIQTPDAALKLCSKRGDIKQGGPVHLSPRSLDSHSADPDDTRLISSPYTNINNQLDLTTLDQASRLLAFALSILRPVRTDYANASYTDAFNWLEVFQLLASLCQQVGFQWVDRHFHVVVFRSQLREGINRDRLGLLDQKSHEEACASGGLLKYWFGSPDQERRNLATCKSCLIRNRVLC